MSPPSICFLTPYAYALFTGDPRGFGGAEVQQRLIARALKARGWEVEFVSYAAGPAREEVVEGIRFHTVAAPPRGASSRFRKPAFVGLWGGMHRSDADVYYQRCAGSITGLAALFTRLRGRPFVFSVANDRDLDGSFLREATRLQGLLFRLGVRLATRVIVQTRKQEKLLAERWGREGVLVPSACALPAGEPPPASERGDVLWVGNMLPKKRPQLMADLAPRLPELTFTMIVPPVGDSAFVREVTERLDRVPNLRRLGRVAYDEMPAYYRSAALLVSTSSAEGFANVFLEAWANGIPVVSCGIDPDGVIAGHGLGVCTGSLEETAEAVRRLVADPRERAAMGERARAYVRAHHSPEAVGARYEQLLRALPGVNRRGSAGGEAPGS